jgi:hypothetical protein
MKTNKYFFTALGFFTGIVSGISIFALVAFTNTPAPAPSGGGITAISSVNANQYFKNFLSGATAYNNVLKGFTLDKSNLDAMNSIIQENSSLAGFRVYFGKDNNSSNIAIVVGVTSSGADDVNNTIYSFVSQNTNACPPVCDSNSPITRN